MYQCELKISKDYIVYIFMDGFAKHYRKKIFPVAELQAIHLMIYYVWDQSQNENMHWYLISSSRPGLIFQAPEGEIIER